ncbi:MAG TPA: hypothetical protein PKL15_15170 [Saprospiraceae bacterium]|nr:hypothetical protein [Saprospiraceae bacterium]
MASKMKVSKKNVYAKQDREDNRKFMLVLALATIALMLMLYFIFA